MIKNYITILDDIKARINEAQRNAVLSVNKELIVLYWNIGKIINEKSTWGNKFVENLERDLRLNFPKNKGFSARNLRYMAKFANEYPEEEFLHQLGAKLPWRHHTELIDKVKDKDQRIWYMQKTAENGWSRAVLIHQMELELYKRQVLANKVDNFKNTLPVAQSELVQQATKDPYIFDFITNADEIYETQIERALYRQCYKVAFGTRYRICLHRQSISHGSR